MKNMSIAKKVFLSSLFIGILLITVSTTLLFRDISAIKTDVYQKKATELKRVLSDSITSKKNIGLTNVLSISNDVQLSKDLVDNDRKNAIVVVSSVLKKFKESSPYKNVKIQLHTKDTKSFLRSWNVHKFGDDLSGFRLSLLKVKRDEKAFTVFEVGHLGITLKAITPLFYAHNYVGSMEFIQGLNSVAKKFAKDNNDLLVLMNNSLLHVAIKLKNHATVGNYTVSQKFVQNDFLNDAKTINLKKLQKDGFLISDKYFYTYKKVSNSSNIGIFLLGKKLTDVNSAVDMATSSIYKSIYFTIALLLILIVLVYFVIDRLVFVRIKRLVGIMSNVDLTTKIDVTSHDEIGTLEDYVNDFLATTRTAIVNSKSTSSENASISHELSITSLSVGKNVENSVLIIEQTTGEAKSIQNEIVGAVSDAQNSKKDIIMANENLETARDEIITLTSKVQDVAQAEADLAQNMQELSGSANEVKSVLVIIGDIADQTNLLALNAAIEAARAGEHGRGFAVVADEVRKLAERTQKTLAEINATISVVVQSIGDASTQMSINSQETQELAEIAQNVETKINETVDIVNKAVIASDSTVNDFENTGKNIDTIVSKVEEVNELSSVNARSIEEIASASEHLNTLTDKLNAQLETFHT